MAVSYAFLQHSLLVKTRCKYSESFFWDPVQVQKKRSECLCRWLNVLKFVVSGKSTLTGGEASAGAPSAPPARLFLRSSLTWVSRSSRSTLSASFARQASSSCDTRLLRAGFLFSARGRKEQRLDSHVPFENVTMCQVVLEASDAQLGVRKRIAGTWKHFIIHFQDK